MFNTIKTIKTIKDAHSPVLIRAVCYNIYRAYKRKAGGREGYYLKGFSFINILNIGKRDFLLWKDKTQENSLKTISEIM